MDGVKYPPVSSKKRRYCTVFAIYIPVDIIQSFKRAVGVVKGFRKGVLSESLCEGIMLWLEKYRGKLEASGFDVEGLRQSIMNYLNRKT